HVLTDTVLQSRFSHVELTRLAIAGGADTIQLRQKSGSTREMIEVARKMKAVCKEAGVTFIVNDRIDVAMAAEADGVHLGQDDFPIPLARRLLGEEAIIGGSAAVMEEAGKCLEEGADYIGFGPVFPTASKDDAGPVSGIDMLKKVVQTIPLPIIAIGGVYKENTPDVMRAGARGIAVISAVCCQKDPAQATAWLREALQIERVNDPMTQTLARIGEFGLIHRIREIIKREGIESPGVTLGIGDDTAAFLPRPGYELLVTCDAMVEGRHYLPRHITPFDLGRRAMTLNISDIGAMGGQPLYALVSLGLKGDTPVRDVEGLYRGFLAELNPFGASIVGGNITKVDYTPFIDITLMGEVEEGRVVRRSTAVNGDAILVTGYPGQAAAGLQLLLKARPDEDLRDHPLVRAYNCPSHRAREGRAVALSGLATAMIDTSDGFLGDLGHICEESGKGARLFEERLPLSGILKETAQRLGVDPYDLVLKDSDDYELIITCSADHVDRIRTCLGSLSDVTVTEVGRITDAREGIHLVHPDGSRSPLSPKGWNHFQT
ncbi:MAG: thiamine-phosphate kinase, partial [Pseudomonadota bacterium]